MWRFFYISVFLLSCLVVLFTSYNASMDEGWGGTMKKTQDGKKNDELFRGYRFLMGIWSGCGKMDGFWLSAENPRQKGPICPRTKKKAPERASVSVLLVVDVTHGLMACLAGAIPAVPLPLPRNGSFLAGALGSPLYLLKKPLFSAYWMLSSSPASDHLPQSVLPILISKSVRP